ncbi:unnamed protein product, partial [Vitis vinifera]
MGKQSLKKKNQGGGKPGDGKVKQSKVGDNGARPYDKDTAVFIEMSQELKEEGNKLFQKRDHEGAMLKYEKALKLLPRNHVDVAYLRSNMAACYMQMGLSDYPRAIHECNLALEVAPKYSKALLKRARCYEALNRLDLALRDVTTILNMEPNNLMALEIGESVKKAIEKKGIKVNDRATNLAPEYFVPSASTSPKVEEEPKKTVKLVFGEDIRRAQLPVNCSLSELREVIRDRFPSSRAVLIKYRDQEGDLVTITTNEELKLAEASVGTQGSIRLYVVEVNPEQDPFFERVMNEVDANKIDMKQNNGTLNGTVGKCKETGIGSSYIDDWIIQFAQLFKNHVGFDSDEYLDLHEHGIKFYSEAMEETVTSEEAQGLFEIAAEKFQEMAALALFNWGNVHMSRARKRVYFTEDASRESVLVQIKTAHDWAQKEYLKAKQRYEEALKIKPDFYEGLLALGQQQFEQAKLSWYYAIGSNVDLEMWPCEEVLQLYNKAEDNMEKGMQMWEELEEQRLSELSKPNEVKIQLQNMGLDGLFKDISVSKAAEQAANMKSQINLIWGTMLYERSIVEFKLGLPVWQESLEVSVEKFELAGASPTDIAIMIKNHCSSNNALEDLGFKIDEIVQAWNEMYEAKRWQSGVPSFRLEPLFRRRVPKLYHALEHV